mmetsp:Transcript_57657/g.122646  ORF Transcript_57657/g.122646 Transcript_57657/m.122646 type:complete len:499 (+) Transcript_57657:125-1621(+)
MRVAVISLGGCEYAALDADENWTGFELLQQILCSTDASAIQQPVWGAGSEMEAGSTPHAEAGFASACLPCSGISSSSCSLASSTLSPSSPSSSASLETVSLADGDFSSASSSVTTRPAQVPPGYGAHLLFGDTKIDLECTLASNGVVDGALLTLIKSRMDISVAIGFKDGSASVWNAETGELQHQLVGHWAAITGLEVSPDGRSVLTTSNDRSCRLWSMTTGQCRRCLGSLGSVSTSAFVGSEEVITISETLGASSIVRKWCLSSGRCLRVFDSNPSNIFSAQAASCGTTLLTDKKSVRYCGGGAKGSDVWCLPSDLGLVTASKQTPDASIVALGTSSGAVQVFDAQRGECVFTLFGHSASIGHIDISRDGRFLMTAAVDGTLKIWSLARGQPCSSHSISPGGAAPSFSPNSDFILFVDTQGLVQIWPLVAHHDYRLIRCPEGKADVAAFSPDGALLLTVSGPLSTARIWDWASGEERCILSSGSPIASTAMGWTRSG